MKKLFNLFSTTLLIALTLQSCSKEDIFDTSEQSENTEETIQQLSDEDNSRSRTNSNVLLVRHFSVVRSSALRANTFTLSSDIASDGFGSAQLVGFVSNPNRSFVGRILPQDRLDLSAVDANINTPENDSFKLVNQFSGTAGELTVTDPFKPQSQGSGTTFAVRVKGDIDGDGKEDIDILVTEESLGNVLTESIVEQGLITF